MHAHARGRRVRARVVLFWPYGIVERTTITGTHEACADGIVLSAKSRRRVHEETVVQTFEEPDATRWQLRAATSSRRAGFAGQRPRGATGEAAFDLPLDASLLPDETPHGAILWPVRAR